MSEMPDSVKKASAQVIIETLRGLEENCLLETRSPIVILQEQFVEAIAQRDYALDKVAELELKILEMEQSIADAELINPREKCVVNDGERAIEAICDYIKSNPAKFPNGDTEPDRMPSGGVAGYFKDDGSQGLYLFTNSGFEEATRGLGKANAIAALRAQGLLVQNNGARAKSRHTVPVLGGGRPEFYAVKESIMNEDERENKPESRNQASTDARGWAGGSKPPYRLWRDEKK